MGAITFDTVRKVGLALPDLVIGTSYGSPALKLGDKLVACLATNKSAEPATLVVVVGFGERDELIAASPDVYYLTDHYVDYPVVLARLGRLHLDALRDLVGMGRRFVASGHRTGRRGLVTRGSRAPGTKRRFRASKGRT